MKHFPELNHAKHATDDFNKSNIDGRVSERSSVSFREWQSHAAAVLVLDGKIVMRRA